MKLMTTTALAIALAAGSVSAQDTDELALTEAQLAELEAPTISFAEAVGIVKKASKGDIIAMELDYPFDGPAYVADIESDTSETMLVVDGMTGEVLADATFEVARPELMEEFMMGALMQDAGAFHGIDGFCPGDEVPSDLMEALEKLDEDELEDAVKGMRADDCDEDAAVPGHSLDDTSDEENVLAD